MVQTRRMGTCQTRPTPTPTILLQAAPCTLLCALPRAKVLNLFGMVHCVLAGGGGGPGIPYHRSFDGSPPPASMMGPEFVTYAGLTLPKPKKDLDYYTTKVVGAVVW